MRLPCGDSLPGQMRIDVFLSDRQNQSITRCVGEDRCFLADASHLLWVRTVRDIRVARIVVIALRRDDIDCVNVGAAGQGNHGNSEGYCGQSER